MRHGIGRLRTKPLMRARCVGVAGRVLTVVVVLAGMSTLEVSRALAASPPTVTTGSLPAGEVGANYSAKLSASSGTAPYTWTVSSGALPSGLALSASGAL